MQVALKCSKSVLLYKLLFRLVFLGSTVSYDSSRQPPVCDEVEKKSNDRCCGENLSEEVFRPQTRALNLALVSDKKPHENIVW
jgi:hypothetical protein